MPRGRIALSTALALCMAGAAGAASFTVSPVRITLAPGSATDSLTVRNNGSEPAVVQLEPLRWSLRDGVDVQEPTRELLATPPIFTLAPGASQIVRVGLRGRGPDPVTEIAYRLLLKEVPSALPAGASGIHMALRINLPVFVQPLSAARPSLQWQARREGGLRLSARNDGNVHLQLLGLRVDGVEWPLPAASGYLLPGQTRTWPVDPKAPAGTTLRLVARTDGGELASDVVVTAP